MYYNIVRCPICGTKLHFEEKSLFCDGIKKHCFDISKYGYTNLYCGKSSGGDPKEAVKSRTDFLSKDYYKPIKDKIVEIINNLMPNGIIVDAGCGEGYYTNSIAKETKAEIYGFDLSKSAVENASRSAKRQGLTNANYFVASVFDLPINDNSADCVVNIFAPCAEKEYSRILKNDGILILVGAGKRHLFGLKSAIYDEVILNEERADLPKELYQIRREKVNYTLSLDNNDDIMSLFSMTPYSYRTSKKDYEKLCALDSIKTEIDVDIFVYGKVNK